VAATMSCTRDTACLKNDAEELQGGTAAWQIDLLKGQNVRFTARFAGFPRVVDNIVICHFGIFRPFCSSIVKFMCVDI
jgi:hypothetical protein